MTVVETSSSDNILTGSTTVRDTTQESKEESADPTGKQADDTSNRNWQKALQDKVEIIRQREKEAEELRAKVKAFEDAQKQAKLKDLSEAEQLRAIADDALAELGRTKLDLYVQEAVQGKQIHPDIVKALKKSPWTVIDAVEAELGNDFTWDQALESVKRHLPSYVSSLVVDSSSERDSMKESRIDSERAHSGGSINATHTYTMEEIRAIKNDPKEWEKHRDRILRQLASGQIV